MKRYFVYACEQMYGGLHGMNNSCVVEVEDELTDNDVYSDYVIEMSYEIMDSYAEITDSLVDRDEFDDEDEYYQAYEEAKWENVDGYVAKIREDVVLSASELDRLAYDLGEQEFKAQYCE